MKVAQTSPSPHVTSLLSFLEQSEIGHNLLKLFPSGSKSLLCMTVNFVEHVWWWLVSLFSLIERFNGDVVTTGHKRPGMNQIANKISPPWPWPGGSRVSYRGSCWNLRRFGHSWSMINCLQQHPLKIHRHYTDSEYRLKACKNYILYTQR